MNLKEKLNLLEDELTRIESPILRLLRDSNDGFDRDQTAHVLTNLGMCPLQWYLIFMIGLQGQMRIFFLI